MSPACRQASDSSALCRSSPGPESSRRSRRSSCSIPAQDRVPPRAQHWPPEKIPHSTLDAEAHALPFGGKLDLPPILAEFPTRLNGHLVHVLLDQCLTGLENHPSRKPDSPNQKPCEFLLASVAALLSDLSG